jgi:hypothetical protein
LPSALDLVLLAFGIPPTIVVSTNNCCYNASLHDFLSSDAYHHHDYFQAPAYNALVRRDLGRHVKFANNCSFGIMSSV